MSELILQDRLTPSSQDTGLHSLFFDEADGILKSIDDAGVVTDYGVSGDATGIVVIKPDLLNLAQFLVGDVYQLPANHYIIVGEVDFGANRIEMITDLGFYQFSTPNFGSMNYSGSTVFIQNAIGVSGNILEIRHFFMTTPNATAIKMTNANSFMCDLVVFLLCARPFDLDVISFCTLEALPIVACDTGALVKDADTCSARLLQYNAGPGTGGVGLTLLGAASGRFFANAIDARPEVGESYYDVQATYSGDFQASGGVFTIGGGDFYKSGTRDQTDIDILSLGIKNVMDSQIEVGSYIAEGDQASTVISTINTPVLIAGTWTLESSERFTGDANGKFTYTGKESARLPIICKMFVDPASGSNREYWAYVRKNGTTLNNLSRDKGTFDAGNPGKMILVTNMDFVTGDYIEIVIENRTNTTDVTCDAQSLIIG